MTRRGKGSHEMGIDTNHERYRLIQRGELYFQA